LKLAGQVSACQIVGRHPEARAGTRHQHHLASVKKATIETHKLDSVGEVDALIGLVYRDVQDARPTYIT